jgi:hypothetical protein
MVPVGETALVVPDWVTAVVRADRWERLGGGYSRAAKWCVTLSSGERAFVKATEGDLASRMARVEMSVYQHVPGPFLPRLIDAWKGDGRAVLVLEDLSSASWPPPYPDYTRPVFDTLDAVAHATPPPGLAPLKRHPETPWGRLGELGVCAAGWIDRAVEAVMAAERAFDVGGDDLVHADVWSDNLCFADRGVVLSDWASAHVGNRWIDVGYAVLSILVEGGQRPPVEIPDEPNLAAYVAGCVLRDASAPLPAWAEPGSTLREEQRGYLVHALRWSAEALGLPRP